MVPSLAGYLSVSDYKLLHIDGYNAVLLRPDVAALFPSTRRTPFEIWRDHYFCRADRPALIAGTEGLQGGYKFGDFDFSSFLDGNCAQKDVVQAYASLVAQSLRAHGDIHTVLTFVDCEKK